MGFNSGFKGLIGRRTWRTYHDGRVRKSQSESLDTEQNLDRV